jgi:hypothetical protein
LYNPTLRLLAPTLNCTPFKDEVWKKRVKDQQQTAACTGFALSALVEFLRWKQWQEQGGSGEAPESISPFMLYYFARRYDDIPGVDVNGGSTARGAMKAWFGQGACRFSLWGQIDEDEKQAGTKWIADAFKTPLGAYFRVDHLSISDLQAALNEIGCVYVTAQVHDGWSAPQDGFIEFGSKSELRGGHAFLLIGYDERGFWIQNSWGSGWALEGFAHLSYADWNTHAMDSWIGQLGVYQSVHAPSLASGLDLKFLSGQQEKPTAVENSLLSGNPSISAQQINPYIIDIGNNGALSDDGKFATRIDDLRNLLQIYLKEARLGSVTAFRSEIGQKNSPPSHRNLPHEPPSG